MMKSSSIQLNVLYLLCFIILQQCRAANRGDTGRPSSYVHGRDMPTSSKQTTNGFSRPSEDNCTWLLPLTGVRRGFTKANARNVVYFTDGTNFDDVVTLFYILKSPFVNLLAVYIQSNGWSNAGPSVTNMRNIIYMISDTGLSIPVLVGSYEALNDLLSVSSTPFLAPPVSYRFSVTGGPGGLLYADTMLGLAGTAPQSPLLYDPYTDADTDSTSIERLLQIMEDFSTTPKSTSSRSTITFLSTGTLTPIAKMFEETFKPRVTNALKNVDGLFLMAGAVQTDGNMFSVPTNKHAEFNIYLDAHAAQYAFKNMSQQGVKIVLVPLDATDGVPITENVLDTLLQHPITPEAQFVGRLMARQRATWFDRDFFSTAFLWDVSAAIVMAHPETVTRRKPTYIRIVTEDGPYGQDFAWTKPCTIAEINGKLCSRVDVVFELNAAAVDDKLVKALQLKTNSAQRAPKCPM